MYFIFEKEFLNPTIFFQNKGHIQLCLKTPHIEIIFVILKKNNSRKINKKLGIFYYKVDILISLKADLYGLKNKKYLVL